MPNAALLPLATIAFAPIHEIKIMQAYMKNCIMGELNANSRSPAAKSS